MKISTSCFSPSHPQSGPAIGVSAALFSHLKADHKHMFEKCFTVIAPIFRVCKSALQSTHYLTHQQLFHRAIQERNCIKQKEPLRTNAKTVTERGSTPNFSSGFFLFCGDLAPLPIPSPMDWTVSLCELGITNTETKHHLFLSHEASCEYAGVYMCCSWRTSRARKTTTRLAVGLNQDPYKIWDPIQSRWPSRFHPTSVSDGIGSAHGRQQSRSISLEAAA